MISGWTRPSRAASGQWLRRRRVLPFVFLVTALTGAALATDAPGVRHPASAQVKAFARAKGARQGTAARSTALIAAYSFDHVSSGVAPDLSGLGNRALLVDARWSRYGKTGGAVSFTGRGSILRVRSLRAQGIKNGMTLEAWVRPAVLGGNRTIIAETAGRADSLGALELSGDRPAAFLLVGRARHATTASRLLAADTWSFLALTWNGTTLRLYLNGALVAGARVSGTLEPGHRSLQIGGGSRFGFRGRIDDVRVYNGAAGPHRISADMRTPVGGPQPTTHGRGAPGTPPATRIRCVWYVDPKATGADNGTSWANAWANFGAIRWAGVQPGDAICLSGGRTSQTYTGTMTIGQSGVAGAPITIAAGRDEGHNGKVIFDYSAGGATSSSSAVSLNGKNYITIEGFEIDDLYNTSSATSSVGISGTGDTGITITHMSFSNDNNPVRITSAAGNTISESHFYGTRGDAAIALAGSTGRFGSTQVYGNYIETVCQEGGPCDQGGHATSNDGPDGVQTGSGVSVHNNAFKEIVLNEATSHQHPDMIQNQGNYTKVYDNDFENVGDSNFDYDGFAAGGSVHDIWIYNNVFRIVTPIDPYPDFIRLYSSGAKITTITSFKIMNNLFADSNGGGGIPPVSICYYGGCSANSTGTGSQVSNNIFVNDGDGTSAGAMLDVAPTGGSGWISTNNVYYRRTTGYISWKGTGYTAADFVTTIDRAGKTALPAFKHYSPNSPQNDFHLASTDTVATHAGANLGTYFTTDKDERARPGRGPWNIGPYQR
jgi:Concanavalin A-like lectin/glucanases superfamily